MLQIKCKNHEQKYFFSTEFWSIQNIVLTCWVEREFNANNEN